MRFSLVCPVPRSLRIVERFSIRAHAPLAPCRILPALPCRTVSDACCPALPCRIVPDPPCPALPYRVGSSLPCRTVPDPPCLALPYHVGCSPPCRVRCSLAALPCRVGCPLPCPGMSDALSLPLRLRFSHCLPCRSFKGVHISEPCRISPVLCLVLPPLNGTASPLFSQAGTTQRLGVRTARHLGSLHPLSPAPCSPHSPTPRSLLS